MNLNRSQTAILLLIKALDLEPDQGPAEGVNPFWCQRIQKAVYLAQTMNVHLGYHFGWNTYGPHSRSLASELNELFLFNHWQRATSWKLDPQSQQSLVELKDTLDKKQTHLWGNLLASVHFLVKKNQVASSSSTEITNMLRIAHIVQFSLEQVSVAKLALQSLSLLS